jgi:hypothetical protein
VTEGSDKLLFIPGGSLSGPMKNRVSKVFQLPSCVSHLLWKVTGLPSLLDDFLQ